MDNVFETVIIQVGDTSMEFIDKKRNFTAEDVILHPNTLHTFESNGKLVCTCRCSLVKTGNTDFDTNYVGPRTVYAKIPFSLRGKRINSDARENYIQEQQEKVTALMREIIDKHDTTALAEVVKDYNSRLTRFVDAVNHQNMTALRTMVKENTVGHDLIDSEQATKIQKFKLQIAENAAEVKRLTAQRIELQREINAIEHAATMQCLSSIDHCTVKALIEKFDAEYQADMADNTTANIILLNTSRV